MYTYIVVSCVAICYLVLSRHARSKQPRFKTELLLSPAAFLFSLYVYYSMVV